MLVSDDEQPGLMVRVTKSGNKTFLVQYTIAGKKRRVPLGGAVSLAGARKTASKIMGQVVDGKDPFAERKEAAVAKAAKAEADANTLDAVVAKWEVHLKKNNRPRYAESAPHTVRRVFAKYLDTPAAEIGRKAIVRILSDLEETAPVMAKRAATYLGSSLGRSRELTSTRISSPSYSKPRW
jgi:hypothetical protein